MLISVIVPAYNDEHYIRDCLLSIINQTYNDFEVIVIDDGSTDSTGSICDEIAAKDKRVKVIHKSNSGVSDSRNVGINEAKGDYICFIDSDDFFDLDYFEQISNILQSRQYSIIFNYFRKTFSNGAIQEAYHLNYMKELSKNLALYELFLAKMICWGVVSTFFRVADINEFKFCSQVEFAEDFFFKYKAIKSCNGKFLYMPLCKYNYMIRTDSSVNSYSVKRRSQDLKVIKNIMNCEPKQYGDILYYKQYLPRLSAYAIQGWLSNDIDDQKVAIMAKNELKDSFLKLLISKKVSVKTKLKVVISFLPTSLIKVFGSIIYRTN